MESKRNIKKTQPSSLKLAKIAAHLAADKKAEDVVVFDMRSVVNFCDLFVICTGQSSRQVQGIAQGIEDGFRDNGIKIDRKQGFQEGLWVLIDLGSVVVHVFEKETREFYGLDYLWQDAKEINWKK